MNTENFDTLLLIGSENEIYKFLKCNAVIQANTLKNNINTEFYYFNSRLFYFIIENNEITNFGERFNNDKKLILDVFCIGAEIVN